jgi:hypothetical protein
VFTGAVSLDGDISEFFDGSGNPLPGVCVIQNDTSVIPAIGAGSEGLADEPLDPNDTVAGTTSGVHPSGFNQRRIFVAYNPNVNGGTVYVGIDLPGGTGSAANPDFAGDGIIRLGPILPFDADGNGDRLSIAPNKTNCTEVGSAPATVVDCALVLASGDVFTDRPGDAGNIESYTVTVQWGAGSPAVQLDYFMSSLTPVGQAGLTVSQLGTTFGALVSRSGGNVPLGTDVEFAITNVNANVPVCDRLRLTVAASSGSIRDGRGGEDSNDGTCEYDLPATVTCQVLISPLLADGTCGSQNGVDELLIGNNANVAVIVSAPAGNKQSITGIQIITSGALVSTNNLAVTLAPGQSVTQSVGSVGCVVPGIRTVTASVTALGVITADCEPIETSCNKQFECCGEPCLEVIKKIACLPANQTCSTASGYADSATGYLGDEAPTFCYSITITNCGQLALNNVTVVDNVLGDLSAYFVDTLGVGASETKYFAASHTNTTINTVEADAIADVTEQPVHAEDTATATVVPASVSCSTRVTSEADLDGNPMNNVVILPNDSGTYDVTFCTTVTSGQAPLYNVTLSNTYATDCNVAPFDMAANTSTTICCRVELSCEQLEGLALTNAVSVTAEVGDCGRDTQGSRITVSSDDTCVMIVDCQRVCITRTPGYWFNHPKSNNPNCATLLKAIEANGGKLDLGFVCLPTRDQNNDSMVNAEDALLEAMTYFPPSGSGATLCGARKKLAFHLIAAIANTALFGTDPGNCRTLDGQLLPGSLISDAQAAAACGDIQAINQVKALLGAFNESGDDADFPEPWGPCGLGGGKLRKTLKPRITPFVDCANTANCASGHACP